MSMRFWRRGRRVPVAPTPVRKKRRTINAEDVGLAVLFLRYARNGVPPVYQPFRAPTAEQLSEAAALLRGGSPAAERVAAHLTAELRRREFMAVARRTAARTGVSTGRVCRAMRRPSVVHIALTMTDGHNDDKGRQAK